MRFLAVYSTAGFWFKSTNIENHSKNSEKKIKKIFSVTHHFKLPKSLRNTGRMHFLTLCTEPFKMRGTTIFFIFFIKDLNKTHKKMMPQKFENFIIAVIEIF